MQKKKYECLTVLGIDPGLARTGWAILKQCNGQIVPVSYGCTKTESKDSLPERLFSIYSELRKITNKFHPNVIAVEELYFPMRFRPTGLPQYPKTIFATSQARAMVYLLAAQKNIDITEQNPKSVKISITGYGNADKSQVKNMVKRLLGIKQINGPDDISDAIAIGLCYLYTVRR